MSVKNDRLLNAAQGDSIISALQAIATTPKSPYNNLNKLNPDYINYDSTHASITQNQVNTLDSMSKITYDNDGYIAIDYEGVIPPPTPPTPPTPISVMSKAVNFYDYDGTVVQSYTAEEFAELSALPNNPSHEGLTAQGWNWSLADAKTYVASYGALNIGQMYVTSDGKTRIYIKLSEGRISPILMLYLNDNSELDIDWGDGSTHSTFTSTSADYKSERHNYALAGEYVITITTVSGSFVIQSQTLTYNTFFADGRNSSNSPDRAYLNSIQKIEIGTGITSLGQYAFYGCSSLLSVSIPDTITSIGNTSFYNCYSLSSITIPDGVTSIGNTTFYNCYSLASIAIPDGVTSIGTYVFYDCYSLSTITIPEGITGIGNNVFYGCYSLLLITIPDTVTSIGNYAFYNCYSLSSILIPNEVTSIGSNAFNYCYSLASIAIPDTVTSIGNYAFNGCYALSSITIPEGVTSIGGSAFYNCYSLSSITIPDTVTSIGASAFSGCFSLRSITLHNGVTSIGNSAFYGCPSLSSIIMPDTVTSIGYSAFSSCYSLSSITIPSRVTNIGTYTFSDCSYLDFIKFQSTTPPTVSASNAFSGVTTSTILYAPALVVNLYMNKTNYPNKATYKYVGFATYESGVTLPTTTTDGTHSLTWYATLQDCIDSTNPITQGNGNEVYSTATVI